jgi:uncharacterized protein YjbI with pentapeptide repeats
MSLKAAFEKYKKLQVPSLSKIRDIASQHSKTSLVIIIFLVMLLLLALQYIPHYQVAQFNITNQKDIADAENSYRATLAQIFGGIAIAIGLYYTWQRNNISQDGQITERFTRAVEQLGAVDKAGNPAIEIRLGGIYSLERIAYESEMDYWPIMEILTVYVRKNSPGESFEIDIDYDSMTCKNYEIKKEREEVYILPLDIQAILTVIGKRNFSPFFDGIEYIDLSKSNLSRSDLVGAHLKEVNLQETNLKHANLNYANLDGANLERASLQGASLTETNLHESNLKRVRFQSSTIQRAILKNANLKGANLKNTLIYGANCEGADFGTDELYNPSLWGLDLFIGANLEQARIIKSNLKNANLKQTNLKGVVFRVTNLEGANFEEADFEGADLKDADFSRASLIGAKNLTVDQLSKVKTLYYAKLDDELLIPLKTKYPHLFEKPK